jgi:hypothetical protein
MLRKLIETIALGPQIRVKPSRGIAGSIYQPEAALECCFDQCG